jgi:23S rRNA pseudouridine2605 synthase
MASERSERLLIPMEANPQRLQKILAAAGLASRRKAEELISAGLVSVNGHIITEAGSKADPRFDEIRVDGKLLKGPERHVYIALYKPKGTVTTVRDPEGRPTVMDLLKNVEERVFPVGRLDYMSEGLLLLTNDGELMAQLTRAGSHVAKTYMVKVAGKPTEEEINKLRNGILLPPEPGLTGARGQKQPGVERRSFSIMTQPAHIQLAVDQENPWYEVTLTEGRNRQIRRMFEQIGHHIEKIKRVRYGSLTLDMESGEFRHLTPKEVNQLRKSLETPFKPRVLTAKSKGGAKRYDDRPAKLDTARFVKGRRGKPAADVAAPAAEGTRTYSPRPAAERAPSSFAARPAARAEREGGEDRPRREFAPRSASPRGVEPRSSEPRSSGPRNSGPRSSAPRAGGRGFDRASVRPTRTVVDKPGVRRYDMPTPETPRGTLPKATVPRGPEFDSRGGGDRPARRSFGGTKGGGKREGGFERKAPGGFAKREGGFAKREGGFGAKKPFAEKPFAKFTDAGKKPHSAKGFDDFSDERPAARKSFTPSSDRKFVRGPGKPAPRGEREGGFAGREGGYDTRRPAAGGFAKREGGFGEKKPWGAKPFGKSSGERTGGKRPFTASGERKFVRGPGKPAAASGFGERREGGFAKREGGFAPRREGTGFPRTGVPKREGGYAKRPAAGGFAKREGGFAPRREGSGSARTGAPKRTGGFGGKREGGPAGRGKTGFSKGPRPGGGPGKRRD